MSYLGKYKSNWRVVIKCKLRGRVELEEVSIQQAYQTDYPSSSRVVTDADILSNLCSISRKVDIIELLMQHSIGRQIRGMLTLRMRIMMRQKNLATMLKLRMMKIVLNFLNNEVPR